MNYDRIILELLDRVSALEDEVKKLKEERTSAAQEITPEENEPVFNGNVAFEINKTSAQNFTIGSAMRIEDERVNGKSPSFDMHF